MLDARGHREQRVFGDAVVGHDAMDLRFADRQRPRLVEDRRVHMRECLERTAVSHDDAAPRRAINAADDRHGRRENERARGRDNEHREHAQHVTRHPPRERADQQRQRREPDGKFVSGTLQRALARLRIAHEIDNARVLTVFRRANGTNGQRPFLIHTAGQQCRACHRRHGDRLAGEARRVDM